MSSPSEAPSTTTTAPASECPDQRNASSSASPPTIPIESDTGPWAAPSEQTPLLEQANSASQPRKEVTTWVHEAKVIGKYAIPLIPTGVLQYSLITTTMISIGHLGTIELGAVSLGAMTAAITGNAICMGLVTSLDTLCAQSFGAGRKLLVGLHVQRMVLFLWIVCIPIGILWLFAPLLLKKIIPDPQIAELAGRYLRIVWFGLPGFANYAAGKRFFQAQGLFGASLWIIMVVAPLNAFLNWFLVWHLQWGFDGAPIAVVIANHLLWICQVAYAYFVDGLECWPGFTSQAFHNWGTMVRLAIPGMIMVTAEVWAFEILALGSVYFGAVALAANSVLTTAINFAFQIPFPLSIATSTRIAHLIGGENAESAKVCARVGLMLAFILGVVNVIIMSALKGYIPRIFSDDEEVLDAAARVLPLCAVFLLFDALGICCNGILRGLGRQKFGSWVQLLCYYVIGVPLSIALGFGAKWELHGLWGGLMIALLSVTIIENIFLWTTNWERSVDDAKRRHDRE